MTAHLGWERFGIGVAIGFLAGRPRTAKPDSSVSHRIVASLVTTVVTAMLRRVIVHAMYSGEHA